MSRCEQCLGNDGLRRIILSNEHIRLSILPEVGGKIAELTDVRTGRNWLWRNPDIPFERGRYGAGYCKTLDSGGWDEVLMSISPAQLDVGNGKILNIPDHGDLVGREWTVTLADADLKGDAICELTVMGRAANYRITRTTKLRRGSASLEVDYSLVNQESFAWPWYWCAHVLLAAETDMHIKLPGKQVFRVEEFIAKNDSTGKGKNFWPDLALDGGAALDLSRSFKSEREEDQFASKVFVRSPNSGSVEVGIGSTNEKLSLQYDSGQLPWLGLWINNHGWAEEGRQPYRNLGLEPTTTSCDNVLQSVAGGTVDWAQPGETRRWSLVMELHS